jgi:aminomethyltransferase
MVPFAGYELPVHYGAGIKAEHLHTRTTAGLFDVSHMGQLRIDGEARVRFLESLVPADIEGLAEGRIRYGVFTNEEGGVLDDLLITNAGDHLYLVVNAACFKADMAHLKAHVGADVAIAEIDSAALIALQGPMAAPVLERLQPGIGEMAFMSSRETELDGILCRVSRSGYTGEDGFEISVPRSAAESLARRLLSEQEVSAIGLGARDTLRLEAGLPLFGQDLTPSITPVEAGLTWSIGKRRRQEGGFPGASVLLRQIRDGAPRKRVGLRPEGRAPVRDGAEVHDAGGRKIGWVSSGGFSPSLETPVSMAYLAAEAAGQGECVTAMVRGKPLPCRVVGLPFVPHNFYRP